VRVLDYRGPIPREQMLDLRIPLEQALGYQAVTRCREPVIVDDRWDTNPLAAEVGDLRTYFKSRVAYGNTVLVVPLMVKEHVIGVVRIDHRDDRAYTPHHAALAMAFASQAAVAIDNAHLYARAHDMAALEERHRLARELHDSVTQALYGVTMYAEAAASLLEVNQRETAITYLREVRETAQDALREMRLLIFELRPPVLAEEGLEGALRARLAAVEGRVNSLSTALHVQGELDIPAPVEEALYGIAQETLNNIYKHARATSITLWLHQAGQKVIMQIRDDGQGFDPAVIEGHGGLGLHGMAERAAQVGGELTVESTPGGGTAVRVEVAL
jgi:signal transduction histidine kinase